MPSIEPQLIVLLGGAASAFCMVILFTMHRSFSPAVGGLAQWGWACGLGMPATLLLLMRGAIPEVLSIVLSNVTVSALIMLLHAGTLRFNGAAPPYRTYAAALATLLAAWTLIIVFEEGLESGLALASFSNMMLLLACAKAVFQAPMGRASTARRFTGGVFLLGAGVLGMRLATTLASVAVPDHLFDRSPLQNAYLFAYPLTLLGSLFGFMLMAHEKLRDTLLDTNKRLEDAVAARTVELRREIERAMALEREVAQATENEQRRIGQELHDDLGQRLTSIGLSTQALGDSLAQAQPELAGQAQALERATSEAIAKVREIAHGMMPVGQGPGGLHEALGHLTAAMSAQSRLCCIFDYDYPVDIQDETVAANLYRIAQESLSNAVRHSRATSIVVRLDESDGNVTLSIRDNGIGPARARDGRHKPGAGLRIMGYRASVIGYRLSVSRAEGGGTLVEVTQS